MASGPCREVAFPVLLEAIIRPGTVTLELFLSVLGSKIFSLSQASCQQQPNLLLLSVYCYFLVPVLNEETHV